uniref:CUB domain-containing protein n=1 Tax=Ciona savignyi TaxID=51511 RepID=H2YDJ1_CIOSA
MANSTGSLANEQTITMVIKNRDSTANDIGLHAYLPEDAELTSFSMNTEGVQYTGKKVDQEKAHDILARAKSEDHSAVVYTPRVIPAVRRDNVVQAESTNLHIKAKKKMTFSINYKQTVAHKIIYGKKMLNRASVVLDMYGGTAEKLVGTIFSPNYPQAYPNSADISWWVRVPQGKNVMLNILELDMEECCDRLTIYDGLSTNGKVLAVLSGILQNNESTVIQTSSHSMFLHLT